MEDNDLHERLAKVEERSKSNSYRIEECERTLADNAKMIQSVALVAQKQDRMEKDVAEIRTDVKQIASKSSKRWDGIVDKVLGIVIGSIIALILLKLGLPV